MVLHFLLLLLLYIIFQAITVNACLGINETLVGGSEITVFPNPNNGSFTLKIKEGMKLSLFNSIGQLVKIISEDESSNTEISVSNLDNGIYFVVGQKDSKTYKYMVVVIN
jgi:Secretion system C-terminal sorting domain